MKLFPWRVFWQFVLSQWIVFSILGFVFGFALFSELNPPAAFRWVGMKWFLFYSLVTFLGSLLNAFRFSRPIQRTLYLALKMANKKQTEGYEPPAADLFDEEIGEYSELEQSLNRIAKKLRKKKEQLQREREENEAFMGSVQEGLMSISSQEKLLFFNSQFATLFMHSSQMGRADLSLSDIFRQPEIYTAFKAVLMERQTQKVTLKLATQLEQGPRHFAISLTPLRHPKTQEIYGVIGVFHDISDIKLAEKIRIDFVENASHELRTPLTTVKGYIETLKTDLQSGQFEQALSFTEVISKNVDRLIELVNDLLSLSALESNAELKLEMMNPQQISDQIVGELLVLASQKNQVIRVICDVEPFLADIRKVEQVLRNLVLNAIKYIPQGKTIQIRWESLADKRVALRVIDDGPGIAIEHHARLFERFYRVDRGRARDTGGTGLGLAIVKHIMQSHGGQAQIRSQLGKGSEFICFFPNWNR